MYPIHQGSVGDGDDTIAVEVPSLEFCVASDKPYCFGLIMDPLLHHQVDVCCCSTAPGLYFLAIYFALFALEPFGAYRDNFFWF